MFDEGGGVYTANLPTPASGATAYMIELTFRVRSVDCRSAERLLCKPRWGGVFVKHAGTARIVASSWEFSGPGRIIR